MTESNSSTICGVATGAPDGGVAIVRVSGPKAGAIGLALVGRLPAAQLLSLRTLSGSEGMHRGERALVAWMPGPRSFTGEDVLELHVHGGERNVAAVVAAVLGEGAVAAGPGDFTRRAFEHGRLDLVQAEGIAAVIGARTDAALEQARRLVAGEIGRTVAEICGRVETLRAEVEAHLDFPEDVAAHEVARWRGDLQAIADEVQSWLRRFEAGRRARERARVVICGPPNAGKSALFNRLLGRERALVSSEAGTTRDYVEAEWSVGSYAAVLVDTAGLRTTDEAVEAGGVARAREQAAGADLTLWVEASDASPSAEAPAKREGGSSEDVVWVENKRDRGCERPSWLGVSATEGGGISELRGAIERWFGANGSDPWIGLARHRDRAAEAGEALMAALAELAGNDQALELVAFQLGIVERRLGEITGRHALGPVGAEVLDRIFSSFCIGK